MLLAITLKRLLNPTILLLLLNVCAYHSRAQPPAEITEKAGDQGRNARSCRGRLRPAPGEARGRLTISASPSDKEPEPDHEGEPKQPLQRRLQLIAGATGCFSSPRAFEYNLLCICSEYGKPARSSDSFIL